MALECWEEKAKQIPVEERREYIGHVCRGVTHTAQELNMWYVMVVWIAGLDKAVIQKRLAYFDYLDDARRQAEYWREHFSKFVSEVYTNFD